MVSNCKYDKCCQRFCLNPYSIIDNFSRKPLTQTHKCSIYPHTYSTRVYLTIHSFTYGSNGTQQYDNNTIVVTIKNQQYSSSINGTTCQIFYDIRIKAHSAQDWQWTDLHPVGTYYEKEYTDYQQKPLPSIREGTPAQSNSQNTVVPLSYYNPPLTGKGISFPINSNSTIDIQVKAYVGYSSQGWVAYQLPNPCLGGKFMAVTALGTSSNWSNTQTITIPVESTNPSSSPTVPEFPILVIIPLLGAILIGTIFVRIKKQGELQK